ncbi:MAG: membrane dipeptidase [Porphyromonas sp.]|nr:membrane dipeptidase [Porphyromonas sp.]
MYTTADLSPSLARLNREVDNSLGSSHCVAPQTVIRPRIALTVHLTEYGSSVARAYTDAVIKAGGIPIVLPLTDDVDTLLLSLQEVDGLLLTGGADLHPMYMGEEPIAGLGNVSHERDRYELIIVRLARRLSLPILGICRGHQLLGVAYGSILYQDLPSQYRGENALNHAPQIHKKQPHHRLVLTETTPNRLSDILLGDDQEDELWINSLHHQAIRELLPPFDEVATATDGVNEAIDAYPELDILAVQWHPEQLVAAGDERQLRLFRHLVERATLYRRARAFHQNSIVLDSHTDTPMFFGEGFDIRASERTRVDLTKMALGGVNAAVMVAYLPQGELGDEAHARALAYAEDKLQELHRQVERNADRAVICRRADEVEEARSIAGKLSIIPAIENGYAIGTDLKQIERLHRLYGIAYITLCHNGDNAICDSARHSQATHGGLSNFGYEVVEEMNRLGIMIDLSHAGDETVRDVLAASTKPVIASHSSARSLCNHPRNLSDEQIIAIAERGGVIQVCLYAGFINENERAASYLDAVDHIEHIIRLVGVEHVGIGSDFDGDGELIGCRTSEDLIRISMELLRRGYTEDDLWLIWGDNFLRVWDENRPR